MPCLENLYQDRSLQMVRKEGTFSFWFNTLKVFLPCYAPQTLEGLHLIASCVLLSILCSGTILRHRDISIDILQRGHRPQQGSLVSRTFG